MICELHSTACRSVLQDISKGDVRDSDILEGNNYFLFPRSELEAPGWKWAGVKGQRRVKQRRHTPRAKYQGHFRNLNLAGWNLEENFYANLIVFDLRSKLTIFPAALIKQRPLYKHGELISLYHNYPLIIYEVQCPQAISSCSKIHLDSCADIRELLISGNRWNRAVVNADRFAGRGTAQQTRGRGWVAMTSCVFLVCWRLAQCRGSKEVLLNPLTISRNENERVLIEPSVNSIRLSIRIKQADEIERILCHKFTRFMMQRAESFIVLRRKPVPVSKPIIFRVTTSIWA